MLSIEFDWLDFLGAGNQNMSLRFEFWSDTGQVLPFGNSHMGELGFRTAIFIQNFEFECSILSYFMSYVDNDLL